MRTFVGPRADYYLKRWRPLAGGSSGPRLFSYAAFFFGPVWLLYRRMYRLFSLTLAAIAGIGTLAELVTRGDPPEVVGEITGLAVASFWGFFGTYFYLLHAQRKIEQLAAKGDLDPDSLARAGGVNWGGALAFAVGSAALALLEAAIS